MSRKYLFLICAFVWGALVVNIIIDDHWFWTFFGEWRCYMINLVHIVPFLPLLVFRKYRLFLACYFLSTIGNDVFFGMFKSWWNYDLFLFWSVAFNPFGTWTRWYIDFPPFGRTPMTGQVLFVNLLERLGWLIFLALWPRISLVLARARAKIFGKALGTCST